MASYDKRAAESYDELYRHEFAEAEDAAARLAELAGSGPALELGVGTGRLAIPLARRGVIVHGIDSSEAMVERLRAKPGGDRISVAVGDFADVGSLVTGPYALVFVAFNTLFELATQEAQARCVAGAASRLSKGGCFVVEAVAPEVTAEQAVSVRHEDGEGVVLDAAVRDASQRVGFATVSLTEALTSVRARWIRYVTVPELDLMARLAGLQLRDRWAGWRRERFTTTSARHVSVYEKR
jgi:SAM-dependent methyltransferase